MLNKPPKWDKSQVNFLIRIFSPYLKKNGTTALDVGCGEGTFTYIMSEFVGKITGVDISSTAVEFAQTKYPEIDFKISPIECLPCNENKLDYIFAIEVVEHILDQERMLREFNRVLKKNGKVFITTVEMTYLKNLIIIHLLYEKFYHPNNPHIRFYTKKTLENLLKEFGFRVIKYKKNGTYFGIIPKGQVVIAEKIRELG